MALAKILKFPNPVNEVTARCVAAGVVLMSLAVVLGWEWVVVPLALGFALRVAAGPRLSPLALLMNKVIVPRLPVAPKLVAGPPKRFAQSIGLVLSTAALIAIYGFGALGLGQVLVAMILVAAFLESAFAFCLGCVIFALLMRANVIPQSVCAECSDISARLTAAEARNVA